MEGKADCKSVYPLVLLFWIDWYMIVCHIKKKIKKFPINWRDQSWFWIKSNDNSKFLKIKSLLNIL